MAPCRFARPRVRAPRSATVVPGLLLALGCGGGDNTGTPVSPSAPRPAPRELTGFEIFVERNGIRVGQVVPLVAYGRYDDGTTGTVNATWATSDPTVVEVGDDGTLTAIGVGQAEVTATLEGLADTVEFGVKEPNPRTTRDRPDDVSGAQIHVLYAVPSDAEDGNLDRYGDIARSFEAIQNWLSEAVGYRLRLDTYGGDLDVTFLRLPFTQQEGDRRSESLISDLGDAVRAGIGFSPNKLYAIYYAGRAAGACGSAEPGGSYSAVYVHRDGCSDRSPGVDPEVASTYEAVMVHELLHAFGAMNSCADRGGGGAHVHDDFQDVMYAGVETEPRDGAVLDVGRDDYFGHGRPDCLDTAESQFWEPLPGVRLPPGETGSRRVQIPPGDWPLRCGLP